MSRKIAAERRAWLKKNKLTPREFAEGLVPPEDIGTVSRWFGLGRNPQRRTAKTVKKQHPSFPL